MKEIKITKGYVAIIDDEFFELVSKRKWQACVLKNRKAVYAKCDVVDPVTKKRSAIFMHRFILSVTERGIITDHIDGNGLNNQLSNLRTCSRSENNRNVGIKKSNTTGYKGIIRVGKRWQCRIRVDYKLVYGPSRASIVEAAHDYDNLARTHHGEFASTNF